MRWLISVWLALVATVANADDLLIFKLSTGQHVAVKTGAGVELLGVFDSVTVIDPGPPTPPPDEPTGPGQLICVRPWSCSLNESDADLSIRESLDAVKSTIPYLRFLPGTVDQRMQTHPAERYRGLVKDQTKGWVFHVVPTKTTPRILHQGPLDADAVLKWVNVQRVNLAADVPPNVEPWLDVDFSQQNAELTGALTPPEWLRAMYAEAAVNVSNLPGFKPIPKSEWSAWVARFPTSRLAKSIRNITEQTMGSCVGHSCANGVEAGTYMQAGDLFFRRLSGMSMYVRIGRSPNSGAYVGDAADEIFARGVLPCDGENYPHTFPQDTDFYKKLPTGWEATAAAWKSLVYSVTDTESAFRVLMDCRLRTHFGRKYHALSGVGYTGKYWFYENSWGDDWGDYDKGVGYDSSFYDSYVYFPVFRDEIPVLMARELDSVKAVPIMLPQPKRMSSDRAIEPQPKAAPQSDDSRRGLFRRRVR